MKPYRIPETASKYIDYDMISLHSELPNLAHPRLRLLQAVLDRETLPQEHGELFTLVASFVQLGMDTHDLIDNGTESARLAEKEMRSRQLKVLAGDYFSSIFYRLLSQAGQVEMIASISSAVCEVNRLKMNLYMKMKQSKLAPEHYLSETIQLRCELFNAFNGVLEEMTAKQWQELLAGICRCEMLSEEMGRIASPAMFYNSWAYWYILQEGTEEEKQQLEEHTADSAKLIAWADKYDFHGKLADKLEASADAVKRMAAMLNSETLLDVTAHIVDEMLNRADGCAPAFHETR